MYSGILKQIKEHKVVIIHRHTRPDGDAIGSQIGLKESIKLTFPKKKVYVVGDETERYNFIGRMDVIEDELYEGALVFVLDCSELSLISDERYKKAKTIIKIDHHLFREEFGNLSFVDSTYESCAGLVSDIIFKLHFRLSDEGAKALYTGMVTDSGRFRFDSTTSKTFSIASKLLEYKFNISDVYNNLYLEDLEITLLRAKFTLKFKLTAQNVAYIKTTKEELEELGVDIFTVSRAMVNTMSGIKGIEIWANFTEDKDSGKVICELRSSKYNINKIAVAYGGGGHKSASGATIDSFEVADKMLEELDNIMINGDKYE